MIFKKQVHIAFEKSIIEKIELQNKVVKDLELSASNETKSTSGDKHETALAMLQIEIAKELKKREVLNELKIKLQMLDVALVSKIVKIGSLIKCEEQYYYLSVALGKIVVNGITVFSISEQAPLSKMFLNLSIGDECVFNNKKYKIESIL